MINGVNRLCNAVYIDDVVQALMLAASEDKAVGEAFLISEEEPVTWREFYGAYERMLGVESTISMNLREIDERDRRYKKNLSTIGQVMSVLRNPSVRSRIIQLPAVARVYRPVKVIIPDVMQNRIRISLMADSENTRHRSPGSPEKPILQLTKDQVDFYRAHTSVRIDKAKRLLGYEPSFDFETGMKLTEMWARYSNLI